MLGMNIGFNELQFEVNYVVGLVTRELELEFLIWLMSKVLMCANMCLTVTK